MVYRQLLLNQDRGLSMTTYTAYPHSAPGTTSSPVQFDHLSSPTLNLVGSTGTSAPYALWNKRAERRSDVPMPVRTVMVASTRSSSG